MKLRIAFAAALALALVAGPAAAGNDLWLHVKVQEHDHTKVTVNLPINLIGKALPMLPQEHFDGHHIHVDEWHTSIAELRELWNEVKNGPDATYVTVEEENESVRVWKEAGYLMVSVVDGHGGENVDVRMPTRVVDALLSGDGERLDFTAAIEALVAEGEGELVSVTGDDEQVRVWVDRVAEAD